MHAFLFQFGNSGGPLVNLVSINIKQLTVFSDSILRPLLPIVTTRTVTPTAKMEGVAGHGTCICNIFCNQRYLIFKQNPVRIIPFSKVTQKGDPKINFIAEVLNNYL